MSKFMARENRLPASWLLSTSCGGAGYSPNVCVCVCVGNSRPRLAIDERQCKHPPTILFAPSFQPRSGPLMVSWPRVGRCEYNPRESMHTKWLLPTSPHEPRPIRAEQWPNRQVDALLRRFEMLQIRLFISCFVECTPYANTVCISLGGNAKSPLDARPEGWSWNTETHDLKLSSIV